MSVGGCDWVWVGVGECDWVWVSVTGCGWVSKMVKPKTNRYLRNDYQFFDTLKTKHSKIRGDYNLLKVKFHELE